MSKCIIYAFLLLAFYSTEAQEKQFKAFAVGFYNVENLFDTVDNRMIRDEEFTPDGKRVWTHEKYSDKIANLASVISQLGLSLNPEGISLLGISEIENDTVVIDLINHPLIRSRNYGVVHHNSPDGRGIDVALIYDKDVFKPISVKPYKVDIESLGSSRPTRDVLLVSGELDGELIHVTVNHWPSRSGGEKRTAKFRNKAAEVNRMILDSLLLDDPTAKFVVLGDLNDDTNNESLTKFLRAKFKPKSVGTDDMYNPMHALFQKGNGTTAWRDRWSLFDQVVLSKAWLDKKQDGLYYHKAVIFNKKYLIQKWGKYKGYPFRTFDGDEYQGGYSDHFPVFVYLLKPV